MSKIKISVLTWITIILNVVSVIYVIYINIILEGYAVHSWNQDCLFVFAGFLFCILCFLFGLVGIVIEITRRNIKGIVICITCVLLNFIFIGTGRENARNISCASNLKCIKLALQQYAMDYSGYFPPENGAAGLEYLRKYDYLTDYTIYVCPSTKTVRGKDNQPLTENIVDYIYIGGLNEKSDTKSPILYDKSGNHQHSGNCLLVPKLYSN